MKQNVELNKTKKPIVIFLKRSSIDNMLGPKSAIIDLSNIRFIEFRTTDRLSSVEKIIYSIIFTFKDNKEYIWESYNNETEQMYNEIFNNFYNYYRE